MTETTTLRTTTAADMSRSDETPFGVAKWTAKITPKPSSPTDPRTAFAASMEIIEEMALTATGDDAETPSWSRKSVTPA